MPKLIHNLRERILDEAARLLAEGGYHALSMRELARRCDVAPGTIYNYFSEKDQIVAEITLADWREAVERLDAEAARATTLAGGLAALADVLDAFCARYRGVWETYDGDAAAAPYVTRYHATLRAQVADPVRVVARRTGRADVDGVADLLAEALLACAAAPELTSQFRGLASVLDAAPVTDTNRRENP